MPKTELASVSRTCSFCGAKSEVTAPFSGFDRLSPEACEFSNFDQVQENECYDCHRTEYLYWHNSGLEAQLLRNQKEILFWKNRALNEDLIKSLTDNQLLQRTFDLDFYAQLERRLAEGLGKRMPELKLQPTINPELEFWKWIAKNLTEFYEERKHRDFSLDEIKKMEEENIKFMDQWFNDFYAWIYEKQGGDSLPESVAHAIRQRLNKVSASPK